MGCLRLVCGRSDRSPLEYGTDSERSVSGNRLRDRGRAVRPTLEGTRLDVPERLGVCMAQFAGNMAGGRGPVVGYLDPSGNAKTVTGTIPAASSGASGNRGGTSGAGATTTKSCAAHDALTLFGAIPTRQLEHATDPSRQAAGRAGT